MATKNTTCKQQSVADCVKVIGGSMKVLRALTGNSDAFKELDAEWKKLARTLEKAGGKRHEPAKKAGGQKKAKAVKPARKETDAVQPQRPITNRTSRLMGDPDKDRAKLEKAIEADIAKNRVHKADPTSVRISDKEVELHLGSFSVRQLAERDASELIGHPMVFWYRRGVFPDPRQSRVNPTVIEAKVVDRKGKDFKAAPFTVHVKIGMVGDASHCLSWAKGVVARNKGDQE